MDQNNQINRLKLTLENWLVGNQFTLQQATVIETMLNYISWLEAERRDMVDMLQDNDKEIASLKQDLANTEELVDWVDPPTVPR